MSYFIIVFRTWFISTYLNHSSIIWTCSDLYERLRRNFAYSLGSPGTIAFTFYYKCEAKFSLHKRRLSSVLWIPPKMHYKLYIHKQPKFCKHCVVLGLIIGRATLAPEDLLDY